jgi:hypothetical protein
MAWTIGSPLSVGPVGIGADPQAVTPVGQPKAAQAKDGVQFGRVFAPGLVALRIAGESRSRNAELDGDKVEERRGRLLPGTEALSRMTQQAELYGKAKAIHAPELGAHHYEVLWTEHVMPRACSHFGTCIDHGSADGVRHRRGETMQVLTDAQWAKFEAAIAAANIRGARPRTEERRTIEAIIWRLDNGAKWRSVPPRRP